MHEIVLGHMRSNLCVGRRLTYPIQSVEYGPCKLTGVRAVATHTRMLDAEDPERNLLSLETLIK